MVTELERKLLERWAEKQRSPRAPWKESDERALRKFADKAYRSSLERERVRADLEELRREDEKDGVVGDGPVVFSFSSALEFMLGQHKTLPISSERLLVEYAIAFANGDTDRSEYRKSYEAQRQRKELERDLPAHIDALASQVADESVSALDRPKAVVSYEQWARDNDVDMIVTERWRAEMREFLGKFVTQRFDITKEFVEETEESLEKVWVLPALRRVGKGVRLVNHISITGPDSLRGFTSMLLLDESRPFGKDLCQCRLDGCGRFFLAQKPRTGRPQRLYCTREHMLEMHARESTRRAKESREKKKPRRPK